MCPFFLLLTPVVREQCLFMTYTLSLSLSGPLELVLGFIYSLFFFVIYLFLLYKSINVECGFSSLVNM